MYGMRGTTILKNDGEGTVRLAEDTITNTYSIGLRTNSKMVWKDISKELHDLLVKELANQEGVRKG